MGSDSDRMTGSGTESGGTKNAGRAEGLARAAAAAGRRGPPPVHLWNPPHCGDIGLRIARDGTWFYQGSPIGRPALVRLFASILRRDPEGHVLVTPVEKVSIEVEDAPFIAQDVEQREDGTLVFTTNVGDVVEAGPQNAIRVEIDPQTGEPRPYLHVRRGLEARIDRKTFYRLVEMATIVPHRGEDWLGLHSQGAVLSPLAGRPTCLIPRRGILTGAAAFPYTPTGYEGGKTWPVIPHAAMPR
ncbi:Uncharacterized protein putative in bacteria [Rubellimicrobium thermophilum DSM 16684]|uniref:Uncharacterized protein putative in bacteria n=1 Tax=Rubellimicrobium thermophilum DSM 16684 TaxID=1123069 RepID=S9R6N8_9RHOB|nr:Uncharacterized protein putative in bacteria [Rubellimicrobium thermophilum DSM 16684]